MTIENFCTCHKKVRCVQVGCQQCDFNNTRNLLSRNFLFYFNRNVQYKVCDKQAQICFHLKELCR